MVLLREIIKWNLQLGLRNYLLIDRRAIFDISSRNEWNQLTWEGVYKCLNGVAWLRQKRSSCKIKNVNIWSFLFCDLH